MVGKHRPRAGCRTCTRRRVKCDGARPECQRCTKGNFRCDGYESRHLFVDAYHGPAASNTTAARREGSTDDDEVAVDTQPSPPQQRPPPRQALSHRPRASARAVLSVPAPGAVERRPAARPPCLDPADFLTLCSSLAVPSVPQQDIVCGFVLKRLFFADSGAPKSSSGDEVSRRTGFWFLDRVIAVNNGTLSDVEAASTRALCTTFFARQRKDPALMKQGLRFYGTALNGLNERLKDPKRRMDVTTLLDTMILCVFELITMTSPDAWRYHAAGLSRLFQSIGPAFFRDALALDILLSCRPFILMYHVVMKKSCFLTSPLWQDLPWGSSPRSLTVRLHDIMCHLPALIEQTTHMLTTISWQRHLQTHSPSASSSSTSSPPPENWDAGWEHYPLGSDFPALDDVHLSSPLPDAAASNIGACLAQLFRWRLDWHAARGASVSTVAASMVYPWQHGAANQDTAREIHFATPDDANAILLYDGLLIALLRLGRRAKGHLFRVADWLPTVPGPYFPTAEGQHGGARGVGPMPERGPPSTTAGPLLLPSTDLTAYSVAVEICRSIGYIMKSDAASIGSFSMLFPLRFAWLAAETDWAMKEWVKSLAVVVAEKDAFRATTMVDKGVLLKSGRKSPYE